MVRYMIAPMRSKVKKGLKKEKSGFFMITEKMIEQIYDQYVFSKSNG